MDAILLVLITDPHLEIKRCILMTVIVVPKLECAEDVWEGNAKFVKQLENSTGDGR